MTSSEARLSLTATGDSGSEGALEEASAHLWRSKRRRVGVVHENHMVAIGLRASLSEAFDVGMSPIAVPDMEVAVVSPTAAAEQVFACPLVVCGEEPALVRDGNVVLAALPASSLTARKLIATVEAAAAGLKVIVAEHEPDTSPLDARSRDVLRMLAAGSGTREIATRLGYSERTIKGVIHRAEIVLGAHSRAQAVAEALKRGML